MPQNLMIISRADIRIVGCIWFIISFCLPVSILASGLEETLMTKFLAICALAAGSLGFVSGFGLLFSQRWAAIILRIISWIYALFFFGYTILIVMGSASMMISGNLSGILGVLFTAVTFIFGVLFLLMGKYLKKIHAHLKK